MYILYMFQTVKKGEIFSEYVTFTSQRLRPSADTACVKAALHVPRRTNVTLTLPVLSPFRHDPSTRPDSKGLTTRHDLRYRKGSLYSRNGKD